MPDLNEKTTAFEVIETFNSDLTGYEVIVTGGSSGIGIETVRALAKAGARCVVTARDIPRAKEVVDELIKSTGNSNIEIEKLELDSLQSINEFISAYLAKKRPLHILINNAGVMACPLSYTKEGLEMQIGTNHFGHFALTIGLLSSLKEAAKLTGKKSRIINVSSLAHVRSDVDFSDMHFKNREYEPWTSYGQSKTANILFSVGLNSRYESEGIISYALHPGVIFTRLSRHMGEKEREEFSKNYQNFKTPEQGAATTIFAAVAPHLENVSCVYLENCMVSKLEESREIAGKNRFGYLAYAINPESADKLWNLSLDFLKEEKK